MITEKALDIKVSFTSEEVFDDAIKELLNRVLEEVRANPNLRRVTLAKHYSDFRVPVHFLEVILDE